MTANRIGTGRKWIVRDLGNALIDPETVMVTGTVEILERPAAGGVAPILDQSELSLRHRVLAPQRPHIERAVAQTGPIR